MQPAGADGSRLWKGTRPLASISHIDPQIDKLTDHQLSRRVQVAGLCSASASDDWFPVEPVTPHGRKEYEDQAKSACSGCEVRADCLILALRYESRKGITSHGIWGGMAPWQRERMLRSHRRRRAAAAASNAELAVAS